MTDARHLARPTTKHDQHAEARPLRRVEEATRTLAPVQMPGRGPFPLGGQRFPGRGAGIRRAADVLALQRTMGNRATQRALARSGHQVQQRDGAARLTGASPYDGESGTAIQRFWHRRSRSKRAQDLKTLKHDTVDPAATPRVMPWLAANKPLDLTPGKDALTTASAAVGVPRDITGSMVGAKVKEDAPDEQYYSEDATYKLEVIPRDLRTNVGIGSSGAAATSSALATVGGITQIIMLSRKLKKAETKTDTAEAALGLVGAGAQTGSSFYQTATSGGATGTKIAALAGDSGSKTVSFILAGIGDAAGVVGSLVQAIVSGAKGVLDIIKVAKGRAKNKKEAILEIITDFLSSAKELLAAANSGIKAVSSFLNALKMLADVVQVVPFVGAAINIASQTVDIVVQFVKTLTQAIRMARARRYQEKMKEAGQQAVRPGGRTEKELLAEYLADINRKRFRRGWLPVLSGLTTIIADMISIGSSFLNIAGTITSGAMGVGLGLLVASYGTAAYAAALKVGAAAVKSVAFGMRKTKQKIRDFGAKHASVHKIGSKVGIDMGKTSQAKQAELQASADRLLTVIRGLAPLDGLTGRAKRAKEKEYESAYHMVKATGLSPKELNKAKNIDEMRDMLCDAMKARE